MACIIENDRGVEIARVEAATPALARAEAERRIASLHRAAGRIPPLFEADPAYRIRTLH